MVGFVFSLRTKANCKETRASVRGDAAISHHGEKEERGDESERGPDFWALDRGREVC